MALGFRSRLKSGIKKVLGMDEPAPAPPVSRPAPARPDPVVAAPQPEPVAEPAAAPEPVAAEPAAAPEPVAAETATAPAGVDVVGAAITNEAVQELLDDMVRPALQADGGDITLIKVEDDNIYVKLVGACSTCPSSIATMKGGVELLLKEEFPTLKDVIQVDT